MKFIGKWLYLLAVPGTAVVLFIIASVFDILVAVIYARFYSTAAFIAVFGVAGIFAGLLAYGYAIGATKVKNEFTRRSIIICTIVIGLVFFFPLARLEGGEYAAAFRSFGVTMAASSLFFIKGDIEL